MNLGMRIFKATAVTLVSICMIASIIGVAMGVRAVPVLTGSMRPHYPAGTLGVTHRVPTSELKQGDIIAFTPPAPYTTPHNEPVMHRIISLEHVGMNTYVETKGDANPAPDAWTLNLDNSTTQSLWFAAPHLGMITASLKSGNSMVAMLSIIGVALIMIAFLTWPGGQKRQPITVAPFRFEASHDYDHPTPVDPDFGSASYEIRSALTHVATTVELVKDETDHARQQELLTYASEGTQRLTRIVEKLFVAFGLETWRIKAPISLEETVRNAVNDLGGDSSKVWMTGSTHESLVVANETALYRGVQGMIEHALFASGQSEDVMVEIVRIDDSTVTVIVSAHVNPSMAHRQKSWPHESSLNMQLIQRVADEHRGGVEFESRAGGIFVALTLPLLNESVLAND